MASTLEQMEKRPEPTEEEKKKNKTPPYRIVVHAQGREYVRDLMEYNFQKFTQGTLLEITKKGHSNPETVFSGSWAYKIIDERESRS